MKEATPELVKETWAKRWRELPESARASFRQRFSAFDFETFPEDTLLVDIDFATGVPTATWGCPKIRERLRRAFLRDDSAVFVGYNNKGFDNRIADAILDGVDEASVKSLSDRLVSGSEELSWRSGERGRRPDWVSRTFDIGFDIGQKKIGEPPNEKKIPEVGLKRWERLNGYRICRSSVPFDRRGLTRADRAEVEKYCVYDVCATALCAMSKEAWDPCLNARRTLVDEYSAKGVNWEMTKPRITGIILNAREENYEVPENWADAFYVPPPSLRIRKNRDVLNAYASVPMRRLRELSDRKSGGKGVLFKDVCGIPHLYGVGGVHGCPKGVWTDCGGGIWSLDAASLYPNLMRHYDFLSRRVAGPDREHFASLIDLRTKVYKPSGDKRADGLKLVLNGSFGSMGFDKSEMYDPFNFCRVTITGQLLITDLLEKLERHVVLIQSNTDGIFFKLADPSPSGMSACREIVSAFERRTKLEMEWTEFESMCQRNVSHYVARQAPKPGAPAGSGKLKTKGAYFGVKHCTVVPYLYERRIHAALNGGATLSPDGFDIARFSIELKRDKNSECFSVDGKTDSREWLDVVPIRPGDPKASKIYVLTKGGETKDLFGSHGTGKRRKASGCPPSAALADSVSIADIDLSWYAVDPKPKKAEEDGDTDLLF